MLSPDLQYRCLILLVLSWKKLIADGNLVDRDVTADTLSLLQIDEPRTFFYRRVGWMDLDTSQKSTHFWCQAEPSARLETGE